MLGWQEQLLSSIGNEAETPEDVFQRIKVVGQNLGFEYVCYGVRMMSPTGKFSAIVLENYPKGWMPHYMQQGYLAVDPSVAWAAKSQAPLVWSTAYDEAPSFWEDARSHGLHHGWAQGTSDGSATASILSLARGTEAIAEPELRQNEIQWRWLSGIAHLALMRSVRGALVEQQSPGLTSREIEVLKWAAVGKTNDDVASILNVSIDTVKFHLKNASRKLDCSNKTHAVAHAAYLGLLS